MLEQITHQVIEIRLGDLVGHVGRHGRELGGRSLLDGRLGHPHFLPLGIRHDQHFSFLAEQQAGDDLAALEGEVGDAEALIDVAIGVQDVLEQPLEPAAADAVELGTDPGALALELVAVRAALLENPGAAGRNQLSSLQTKSGCSIPLGVEPCHSILSWLIRLVTTLPTKIVPR